MHADRSVPSGGRGALLTMNTQLDALLQDAIGALRKHFKMEVAFISQFKAGQRVFRYVDAMPEFQPITVGGSNPLEDSYCQRVVDGRLPGLIPNAQENCEALTLEATLALSVGAHMSAPIRVEGDQVFGTLCCFSRTPDLSLQDSDLQTLRLYADFVGRAMRGSLAQERAAQEIYDRTKDVLDQEAYSIVYQPIFNTSWGQAIGFEALTRFTAEPVRSPDLWFKEAATVGLQQQLEVAVIAKALREFHAFPQDVYLAFNVSPETIVAPEFAGLFEGYPLERIVLEVTEHACITDYSSLELQLGPMRQQGLRLAVDDVGAGYANFRHILKLRPDFIKIDASLISQIDKKLGAKALVAAVVRFTQEAGGAVVAEGVENAEELQVLTDLQINFAQGYLLGRPQPLSQQTFPGRSVPARRVGM